MTAVDERNPLLPMSVVDECSPSDTTDYLSIETSHQERLEGDEYSGLSLLAPSSSLEP
jgi:hypothetical protein